LRTHKDGIEALAREGISLLASISLMQIVLI
jgi:hypothetical protein